MAKDVKNVDFMYLSSPSLQSCGIFVLECINSRLECGVISAPGYIKCAMDC